MFSGVPVRVRGFSIIELVIALAVGMMIISGVIIVSFSSLTSVTSSELSMAAAGLGAVSLQNQRAVGKKDFNLVNSTSTSHDNLQEDVTVSLLDDFVTKLVTILVTDSSNGLIHASYSTLLTNLDNVDSPNTCYSEPVGDWEHPTISSFPVTSLIGTSTGVYSISQIDAFKSRLYVAIESALYKTDPTLLIVDIHDLNTPTVLGKIDTASTTTGLAGIRAANFNGHIYVFGANSGNFSKGQLQIFDVTNSSSPFHVSTYKMPISFVPAAGNGNAIYYKDGYVYLGLTSAPGITEFNVVDTTDVSNPLWIGGYSIGSGIESIIVRNGYAYLATDDNSKEFAVLSVKVPTAPSLGGIFNAPGSNGSGYGRSQYVLGDTVFFGRTWALSANTPELYVLNTSNPMSNASAVASRDIGTTSPSTYGLYGVLVRKNLAYLLTKAGTGGRLQIFDLQEPESLSSVSPLATLVLPYTSGGISIDCEGNTIFIGSNDSSNNGYVSVVTPG